MLETAVLSINFCEPGSEYFSCHDFTLLQFPTKNCFVMTTNKVNVQSFRGKIELDLRDECFSHGKLDFALSRTTNSSNISILSQTERIVQISMCRDLLSLN